MSTGQMVGERSEVDMSGRTVTATGSTTARLLADRWAEVANVLDFGAICDGVADDTAAVEAAYAAAVANGKGVVVTPVGTCRFNLTITHPSITIRGAGRSSPNRPGGSIWKPVDLTRPVVQIGNGTAVVENVTLRDFAMHGDETTVTSDGLSILGAHNIVVSNFYVFGFGRDNITIASSGTRYVSAVYLSDFQSTWMKGNAIKVVYGPVFVTAVFLDHFWLICDAAKVGSRTIYSDGVALDLSSGWMDSSNGQGVYLAGASAYLNGDRTVHIDSGSHADVLVEVDATQPHRYTTDRIRGGITVDGFLRWNVDSATVDMHGTHFSYHRFTSPSVLGKLGFDQAGDSGVYVEEDTPQVNLRGSNGMFPPVPGNGFDFLEVVGGAFRPPMTYQQPLQTSGSPGQRGAIWRSAGATGQLRWDATVEWPGADTDGVPISTFVAVPASAAAAGTPGQWSADASWLYVCHATNTWKRVAIATW